jgi:hypothetical protein
MVLLVAVIVMLSFSCKRKTSNEKNTWQKFDHQIIVQNLNKGTGTIVCYEAEWTTSNYGIINLINSHEFKSIVSQQGYDLMKFSEADFSKNEYVSDLAKTKGPFLLVYLPSLEAPEFIPQSSGFEEKVINFLGGAADAVGSGGRLTL